MDPITRNLMVDPVLCSDGQTYDRCCRTLGRRPRDQLLKSFSFARMLQVARATRAGHDMAKLLYGTPTACFTAGAYQRLLLFRLTAYELAVRGSRMPRAPEGLSIVRDDLICRECLRHLYPALEDTMRVQREACVQARSYPSAPVNLVRAAAKHRLHTA